MSDVKMLAATLLALLLLGALEACGRRRPVPDERALGRMVGRAVDHPGKDLCTAVHTKPKGSGLLCLRYLRD